MFATMLRPLLLKQDVLILPQTHQPVGYKVGQNYGIEEKKNNVVRATCFPKMHTVTVSLHVGYYCKYGKNLCQKSTTCRTGYASIDNNTSMKIAIISSSMFFLFPLINGQICDGSHRLHGLSGVDACSE